MDVAVDPHQARVREPLVVRSAAGVQAEVEAVRIAQRKDVVVERILVGKTDRRAERDDHDARMKLARVQRHLDPGKGGARTAPLEPQYGVPQIGRRTPGRLANLNPPRDLRRQRPGQGGRDAGHGAQRRGSRALMYLGHRSSLPRCRHGVKLMPSWR